MEKTKEKIAKALLWVSAIVTVGILLIIIGYILSQGIQGLSWEFLTESPRKMGKKGGIFPFIIGTIYYVVVTILIAGPIGVGAAIYLTEYTKDSWFVKIIRFGTEALAGVPSIIFGLFGFTFFVIYLGAYTGGWNILSAGLTVAFMILPTIIRTSEEALKTVPHAYREGSLALGATKLQTIVKVILPSAIPGIVTGLILAVGRAIGETAAVVMTLGSSLRVPVAVTDSTRTLATHLYVLATESISKEKAFATASTLIITILLINFFANWLKNKFISRLT
jgi:phosphate transport system permease protein